MTPKSNGQSDAEWERWRGEIASDVRHIKEGIEKFTKWSQEHEYHSAERDADIDRRLSHVEIICERCHKEREAGVITKRQLFVGLILAAVPGTFGAIMWLLRVIHTGGKVLYTK